jgi:hypothetical protein
MKQNLALHAERSRASLRDENVARYDCGYRQY